MDNTHENFFERGIIGVVEIAYYIFLFMLPGVTAYVLCLIVGGDIGFGSKEEMKIASYNKRVEKEAKSVFDDLLVKGWKYRYKKEIFQKDVIKTLGKMVKDQSFNQDEE